LEGSSSSSGRTNRTSFLGRGKKKSWAFCCVKLYLVLLCLSVLTQVYLTPEVYIKFIPTPGLYNYVCTCQNCYFMSDNVMCAGPLGHIIF
jgi:hypothetical protein